MPVTFEIGDVLPPLKHTATALQLFRYSAVTWNPHRIHFDESYAREEGHAGLPCTRTCGPRSPCAASPRASARTGRSPASPTACASPVYAPADLAYTARVTAAEGDS